MFNDLKISRSFLYDAHACLMQEVAYYNFMTAFSPEFNNLHLANRLGMSVDELKATREKHYPDAWMFADPSRPVGEQPFYRVFCRTPEELAVAYTVKPEGVSAEMVREFEI